MPGRLLVAYVQEAEGFDPKGPDKDKYQLAWDSVKLGGPRNLIEVVVASPMLDPRDLVNRRHVLSLDHPPTSMVLVRIGDKVYGPLNTDSQHTGRQFRITLQRPPSSELTSVLDWSSVRSDPGFLRVPDVTLAADGQPVNRSTECFSTDFQILSWNRFEALQAASSERVRLFSDEEIVRQAAKKVLSRKQARDFMAEWERVSAVYLTPRADEAEPETAEVLAALNRRLQAQCDSVDELIRSVVESEALSERVEVAIKRTSEQYVETRAASLDAKIAETIAARQQRVEELRKQEQHLENELERRRRQEDLKLQADLKRERATFTQWAEAERATIERARAEIDARREQLEQGLNEAAARFQSGRDTLVADFLSLSPFLRQLGALGETEARAASAPKDDQRTERLSPPAFLDAIAPSEGLRDEALFFERFTAHVEQAGFRFRRKELLAFHLSMKCGDLTVLGGLSGTGKSSLPVLYAQALSGDLNRYLRVDVSPAWLEPGDLLGRPNLLDQRFQPAPTGVFHTLVWAASELQRVGNDSRIWIVCLDEMNLAQPEHYFSGFLQALPHAADQRAITVFSESAVRPDDPWRTWARLPLGGNLRFIGTVNYDETTKALSQRLLDRSNQLRFDATHVGSLQRGASTDISPPDGQPVTVEGFEAWTHDAPLPAKAAEIIDELQAPLSVLGCPLTPRRYQAITRFVASANGLCSPEEAFDMQLRQRILSLVRGLFRPEARRALESVRGILANDEATFEDSLRMIERMQRENAREIDFEAFDSEG
jgi:hypothetical protein